MLPLCDLHCDTAYNWYVNNRDFTDDTNHISLNRVKGIYPYIQVLAHYIADDVINKYGHFLDMLKNTQAVLSKTPHFKLCRSYSDILSALKERKYAAVLSVEGGGFFSLDERQNDEIIKSLCDLSILFFSPCYNKGSNVCAGAFCEPDYGLTRLGEKIINKLVSASIVIDLSHLSHNSCDDILSIVPAGSVTATHSNCYELCEHPRNLYTSQISKIIGKHGLIGINLYPPFLSQNGSAAVNDIVRHILFILEKGGSRSVCFGADFDGVEALPLGINGIESMQKVYEALLAHSVPEQTVNDIFYNNVKEFINKHFKGV